MRIIVPIKQVPETNAVKMDEATGTMVRDGVEAIINPLDLYAIEIAISLRESSTAVPAVSSAGVSPADESPRNCEVVAISMGPPKADSALREAIAMGCDRGVLISDKAFAGSDTWATSYVLAAAVRKLCQDSPADLIICGERATDGDTGQVGPGIASFLDLPVASYVSKVQTVSPTTVRVHRLVEDGYEVLEVDTPAVLTVVKEVGAPRLPTLRGKQKARQAEIPVWGVKDLGVEENKLGLAGSPTRVVKIFRPQVARKCEKIQAGDEQAINDAAVKVVEFLKNRELI